MTGTLPGQARPSAGRITGKISAQSAWRNSGPALTSGICLLLALLPFLTAPGEIISDTKLNLAVSPAGFLARALTLWDPQQFGGLQNQAVGYLFPMGPFFVLGKLAAVPAWITQRLWIAVLLIAAFTGAQRLAARLGIGVPWTRAVAGLAYALSPIALSMIGEVSGEFLPMAMLPWIILPLAGAVRGLTSPARAAARSAVAVALCSGMNAASTAAVLVPALIYILTSARTRTSPSRWRLLAWWAPASLLATCCWSVPLVLLARYGVSYLPYTESAAVTTSATSLSDVLRGVSDWISYLNVNGQPWWPLGFRIATGLLPILLTGLIAAAGLAGLVVQVPAADVGGREGAVAPVGAASRIAERRFLLFSVIVGVVIIGAGHVSSLGNPLAGPLDSLINGAASPFRNLWKFDPVVRLPVAFGLAHLLATRPPGRVLSRALFAATGLAIAGLAGLAFLSGLAMPGSFGAIPSYWVQTAGWLNAHAGHQGVLVEPGAPFGQYLWGTPLDDVLSPLTTADYARRDLSDIGSVGNERLLDAIDQQLAAGDGSASLTDLLARMGVKYLVVRNDLDRSVLNGAWPARIHQALAESPGITRVARFGAFIGTFVPDDAVSNFDAPYPPVEIYQVAGAEPAATVQPAGGTLRVYGGPESLLTLAAENLLGTSGTRPVLLNDDGAGQPASASVVSDSLRRRVTNFGEVRTSYSPTLTATQPATTFEAAGDFIESGWNRYQSVAGYTGIADVSASSSASDVAAIPGQWSSGLLPFAAVDGNLFTRWESGSWTGPVGQWIQVKFDAAADPRTIYVAFDTDSSLGPAVTQVRISTAAGQATDAVAATSSMQPLRVPPGSSGWLRITVTGLASRLVQATGAQVSIYDMSVPGIQAARTIVAPAVPGPDPSAVVLAKDEPQPSGCMLTSMRWVCSPLLTASTEEQYGLDRTFYENAAERAVVHGSAILVNSSLADKFTRLSPHEPQVTASSAYTGDPQDQATSAFDGNPATSWVAGTSGRRPTLRIRWGHPRTVSRLTIERPPGASGLLQVQLTGSNGQLRGAWVGESGAVRFAPMRTSSLTLTFMPSYAPVQITDVDLPGVPHLDTPGGTFRLPCGLGPSLTVDGTVVATRVTGSLASLRTERPVHFTACSPVRLAAGANRLVEPVSDAFSIQDAVVQGTDLAAASPSASPQAAAHIVQWTATARTLRVSATARSYLVVNENFNPGWKAVIGGRTLQPVRLDGWKQAWVLPAGTSGLVRLTFGPELLFRVTVIGGLAVLALVVLVALWPLGPRRRRRPPPARIPRGDRDPLASRGQRGTRLAGELLLAAAVLAALAGAGLWLGGYPGAVILPLTTIVFLAAASGFPLAGARSGRLLSAEYELPQPWVLAGLVMAATISGVAGQLLQSRGAPELAVTALQNGIPQVLLITVIGRLAAALILS